MTDLNQKQAYLLMIHDNTEQVNLLLQSLDSSYSDIFIHIDKKSNISRSDIVTLKYSKVYFSNSLNIYWAEYSQVQCEIDLLHLATETGSYRYYHLLSGADFPLKNQDDIFLHYTTLKNVEKTLYFVRYYHFFQEKLCIVNRDQTFSIYKVFNKLCLLIQQLLHVNRLIDGIEIKKGANWFSIPDDFAHYVLAREDWIYRHFKYTRSPDEFFLQTLAFNSDEFKRRIYRFYEDDSSESCLRYIDWMRGTPYVFRIQDFDELKDSDMFFARKFDMSTDTEILEKLYRSISA